MNHILHLLDFRALIAKLKENFNSRHHQRRHFLLLVPALIPHLSFSFFLRSSFPHIEHKFMKIAFNLLFVISQVARSRESGLNEIALSLKYLERIYLFHSILVEYSAIYMCNNSFDYCFVSLILLQDCKFINYMIVNSLKVSWNGMVELIA